MCISSHSILQSDTGFTWTHGQYFQFATFESGSTIVSELSFTSSYEPTQIYSLSTPDNFSVEELVLFPTLSWLAFLNEDEGRVLV